MRSPGLTPTIRPMRRLAAWLLALPTLLVCAALLPGPAQAHSSSNSYLSLEQRGSELVLRADMNLRDVDLLFDLDRDRNGQVTWAETAERSTELQAWLDQGLQLRSKIGFDFVIRHIAIGIKTTRKSIGKHFGFIQGVQINVHAHLPQMILRPGSTHATTRSAQCNCLATQQGVVGITRGPVDGVFQYWRNGIVVFRASQQQGIGLLQLFEKHVNSRWPFLQVSIVKRNLTDIGKFKFHAFRQLAGCRTQQTGVARLGAQTA